MTINKDHPCLHGITKQAKKQLQFNPDVIRNSTYLLHGRDAIRHIFSVAASIDSLIIGETQITGQFKNAITIAKEAETLGSILDRLAQEALFAAKKIRSQTLISQKTVSISHAALDLSKKVFENLSEQKILIIGTGEMGQVAAKYARKYQPKELFIVNRTLSKARDLVEQLSYGCGFSLTELPSLLTKADIVISATSKEGHIINRNILEEVHRKRAGRTLFLVDIALPRDIEQSCADFDEVYLFDIDDLKQVVDENSEVRKKAAIEAQGMVQEHTENFLQWLEAHAVKPAISKFNNYLNELFTKELERSLNKGPLNSITPSQREALNTFIHSIKTKMGGDIARSLNNPPNMIEKEKLVEAINILFAEKRNKNIKDSPKTNVK
ncbi:MAG: glutamyl-tRNA reductase [Bdellovibrionota bacterium]